MASKAAVLGLGIASVLAGPSIDSILNTADSRLENSVSSLYAQTQKQVKYTELTDANYKKEVLDYKGAVIVMFYAKGLPSVRMTTVMDALMQQYGEKIKFARFDVTQLPNVPATAEHMKKAYGVDLYPTTVMYSSGKEIDRLKGGPVSEEQLTKWPQLLADYWIKLNITEPRADYTYKFSNSAKFNKIIK